MNFENSKFNKLYQWDFNNERKIRMVMIPWFMEKYLEINNFGIVDNFRETHFKD